MGYILDAIYNYRFSPDEVYRLKKEAAWQHQFSSGTGWTFLALAVIGALWTGRKTLPKLVPNLREALMRWWKPAAVQGAEVAEHGAARSEEEMSQ